MGGHFPGVFLFMYEMEASRLLAERLFRLHPEDVELLARRVAELVRGEPELGYIDTASVARMLSVSHDWVRAHASELGAVRLGEGPRGALRFDVERVRGLLERRSFGGRADEPQKPRGRPRGTGVPLVPIPRRTP
jgi:hypothetical protein